MILAEENKLDVGAPVAQYLPEFKDVKVGVDGAAAKRPMTVQDLMRHTSGLTYGLFGNSDVDQLYRKANIFAAKSLADMVKTIASLPLLHQPGEAWEYSVSTDVLGRVVEVASGMDFDSFIQERITGPLKMNDTGFWVKPPAVSRLARLLGGYRYLRAFRMSRKHHHRLGARDALDQPDGADELFERRGVGGLYLEQHRVLAGDVMAFEDIIDKLDGLLEQVDRLGMGDGDADKGAHILTQPPGVNRRVITHNHAAVLELLDPLNDRRRRQPHLLPELDVSYPPVILQN